MFLQLIFYDNFKSKKDIKKEMSDLKSEKKKVILITGASSGFGKACARYLATKGNRVYGTGRNLTKASQGEKNDDNDFCLMMVRMDVCDALSVKNCVELIIQQEGRIDVVINNAGIGIAGSVEDTSEEEMLIQLKTNFIGALNVIHAVLPFMREQKSGYIINISSLAGLLAQPFVGAYCASKFALEGLAEALRMEVKPFGIKVVLIEPGDFKTGFTQNRIRTKASQKSNVYLNRFNSVLSLIEKDETNGADPDQLAFLVERVLLNPSPRLRYTTGKTSQRFIAFLKRLVPGSFFEWVMMKNYRLID